MSDYRTRRLEATSPVPTDGFVVTRKTIVGKVVPGESTIITREGDTPLPLTDIEAAMILIARDGGEGGEYEFTLAPNVTFKVAINVEADAS